MNNETKRKKSKPEKVFIVFSMMIMTCLILFTTTSCFGSCVGEYRLDAWSGEAVATGSCIEHRVGENSDIWGCTSGIPVSCGTMNNSMYFDCINDGCLGGCLTFCMGSEDGGCHSLSAIGCFGNVCAGCGCSDGSFQLYGCGGCVICG